MLKRFFPIRCCSLSYKNGDYPYRVLLGNTITVLFIGRPRRIEFPKEETKEVEAFTLEEVGDILKALESEPWHIRAVIEVALFTGCWRGEIVGLKWANIYFENQRISVKRSIYKLSDDKLRPRP